MAKYYEDKKVDGYTLRHYFKTGEYAWTDYGGYLYQSRFATEQEARKWRTADQERRQKQEVEEMYGSAFLRMGDYNFFTCPHCKCVVEEDHLVGHYEAAHG
jgi:heme-degrading monooxygenase HmoA